MGRVLDCLEEKGILDSTLIIFTSDHGEMLQDKGYYSKQVPYDSSVRVPMLVKYPAEHALPEGVGPGTRDPGAGYL